MTRKKLQPFTLITKPAVVICTLCVILGCTFSSSAQVTQTHRYEREHKNSNEYFTIISLTGEGIALFREQDKYTGNRRKWELIALDTTLKEKFKIDVEIEQRYTMLGYEYVPGHIYFLFRMGDTNKNKIQLIDIDIAKGEENSRVEISPELDFKVTHFSKIENHLVLGGYVSNDPAVLLYNLTENQIKVLPGFFQKDTELVDVRVNQNKTFNTILIDRSIRTDRKLIFRTFDEDGNILLDTSTPVDENVSLQTSISSTLEREDLIVIGSWGQKNSKQSSGVFTWTIDPFQEQKIQYLYFGQLENFLGYLKPKRAQRIKERTRSAIEAGKKPDFTAHVVPFKIHEHEGGFLVLAEVYDPQSAAPYYSNPYNNPGFYTPGTFSPYWPGYNPGLRMYRAPYMYGNNMKNNDQIKTFETAVLSFDPKGKLLWDASIKLEDMTSIALEQEGDFYFSKSAVTLMYKKESELKIKIVTLGSGDVEEKTEKINLNDPVDEIRSEQKEEGGISAWSGNTFYVWGYQTLRNVTRTDRVRDVFYINKVIVH